MTVSYTDISAAMATRLTTVSGGYAIQNENETFNPPAGAPFLSESMNPTGVVPVALRSGGTDALEGFYQVLCYAPAGLNKGAAFTAAVAVEARFVRGLRLTHGATTVAVLRTERSASFKSGDRFVVPISIYYRALA
jgi:hypothetical protein